MDKVLTKVDRIISLDEAKNLQHLNVDYICVCLNTDYRYSDFRIINKDIATAIRKILISSKYVGEINVQNYDYNLLCLIKEIGFDYIQIAGSTIPSVDFEKELSDNGIEIIVSDIQASLDDDPSWIVSEMQDKSSIKTSFFQLDLFGDTGNSWDCIKNEAPNFPDDLQVSDIIDIGKKFPIFITLDYTINNIINIANEIPTIKGITMTIAETIPRNDIHSLTYSEVLNLLEVLKC